MLLAKRLLLPLGLVTVCSCGSSTLPVAKEAPTLPGQRCKVTSSQLEPLIVEWPSASRARLEALARSGAIAVRYSGCEMDVLYNCQVPTSYKYIGITRKKDSVHIGDADTLYAKMPLGAASLEGKLSSAGELNVHMTIVGRYQAEKHQVPENELRGQCAGATHIITGITTGAFDFFAGVSNEREVSASAMGAKAGAGNKAVHETLNQDGQEGACEKSTDGDTRPPQGCGALLQVEVTPLACPGGVARDASGKCTSEWESALAKAQDSDKYETGTVDKDGYALYVKPVELNSGNVQGLGPGQNTPEDAVIHFYASMIRGDSRFQEVLPPVSDDRSGVILRKLVGMRKEGWVYKQVKLLGKKDTGDPNELYIHLYMRIGTSGDGRKEDDGIDTVTVEKINGRWFVTRPPT